MTESSGTGLLSQARPCSMAMAGHDSARGNPLGRRIGLAACGAIVALMAAGCGTSSTSGNSALAGGTR